MIAVARGHLGSDERRRVTHKMTGNGASLIRCGQDQQPIPARLTIAQFAHILRFPRSQARHLRWIPNQEGRFFLVKTQQDRFQIFCSQKPLNTLVIRFLPSHHGSRNFAQPTRPPTPNPGEDPLRFLDCLSIIKQICQKTI